MAHDVYEEFRASGKELIDKAKEILQEGNVRRMVIKNRDGETLFKLPLAVGVVGVGGAFALAPILSTIAAFAFFVHDARIIVERYPDDAETGLVNLLDDDPFDDGHNYPHYADHNDPHNEFYSDPGSAGRKNPHHTSQNNPDDAAFSGKGSGRFKQRGGYAGDGARQSRRSRTDSPHEKTGHTKRGTRHGDGSDPYEIDADFEVVKP